MGVRCTWVGGMHLDYLNEIVLSFTVENTNFILCVDKSVSYTFYCIGYLLCVPTVLSLLCSGQWSS